MSFNKTLKQDLKNAFLNLLKITLLHIIILITKIRLLIVAVLLY